MAIQESFLSKVSDAVRGGTVGQEVKRSAKWFQDKIKGLKGDLRNRFSSTNAAKFYLHWWQQWCMHLPAQW